MEAKTVKKPCAMDKAVTQALSLKVLRKPNSSDLPI
jgi:hypothetical protein